MKLILCPVILLFLFPISPFAQMDTPPADENALVSDYENVREPVPDQDLFPKPKELERSVNFWRMVYTQYSSSEIIVRDTKYPDKILSVFISPDPPSDMYRPMSKTEEEATIQVKQSLMDSLIALHNLEMAGPVNLFSLPEEEFNLYNLYSDLNEENRFLKAASQNRLKAQRGASDKLRNAIIFSGLYTNAIREIILKNNAPLDLSLLPFIESMFNPMAVSSAGAQGLWQITTATAHFERLKINNIVDERRDYLRATEVAIKKLSREHDEIVQFAKKMDIATEDTVWPHAITAYNAGKGVIFKALKRLRTQDLPKMLFEFRHRSIGFDVRNFYAQFLAMIEIHADLEKYFPDVKPFDPIETLSLEWKVTDPISLQELADGYSVGKEILIFLNPHLQLGVIKGLTLLPKDFVLRIPYPFSLDRLAAFLNTDTYAKYKGMPASFVTHTVRYGETLSQIAGRYGIPLNALMQENNLKRSLIRAGAKLKIPSR